MLGLGVPSKTYNILSAGKPILFIGDIESEIALLIKENQLGYVSCPGNIESIKEGIEWFFNLSKKEINSLQTKCRKIAVEKYSKNNILQEYSRII